MDAEARLAALWAEAKPPASDPAFAFAVMERMERARVLRGVFFELVPLVVVLGVVGWALAPAITDLFTAVVTHTSDVGTTGLAIALSVMFGAWLTLGGLRVQRA